jgi:hypothetical protein
VKGEEQYSDSLIHAFTHSLIHLITYRPKIRRHDNFNQFQIGAVRAGLVSDAVARLREGAP